MTPAYCARSNDIRVIIPASRECLLTLDAQDIFSPYCTLSSNAVLIKARSWVSLRRSSDAPRRRLTRSLPIHYAKSLRFIFCSFSSMKPDSARFRTRFSWESRVVTVECVRNEGKAEGGRERGNHAIFFQSRNYISVALLCEHPARKVNNTAVVTSASAHPSRFRALEKLEGNVRVPVWPRPIMKSSRWLPIMLLCCLGVR